MKKQKKVLIGTVVLVLSFIIGVYAGVQMKSKSMKQFKFNMSSGYRIIVIDSNVTKTYIRITPKESKVFDYKVSDGKTMKGILTEE